MDNYRKLIEVLIQALVVPILPLLSAYIIALLKKQIAKIEAETKSKELRDYIDIVENTIETSVKSVMQTYVEQLKKDGAFTKEAQEEAFNIAKEKVIATLTDNGTRLLEEAYGDYEAWINDKIEQLVNESK